MDQSTILLDGFWREDFIYWNWLHSKRSGWQDLSEALPRDFFVYQHSYSIYISRVSGDPARELIGIESMKLRKLRWASTVSIPSIRGPLGFSFCSLLLRQTPDLRNLPGFCPSPASLPRTLGAAIKRESGRGFSSHTRTSAMPLVRSSDPLVWIDCEVGHPSSSPAVDRPPTLMAIFTR